MYLALIISVVLSDHHVSLPSFGVIAKLVVFSLRLHAFLIRCVLGLTAYHLRSYKVEV